MPFANTALSTATTVSLLASAPWSALAQKGNSFKIVGDGKVSAQMMFLGTVNTVYIVDKTENNPFNITNDEGTHPAWASEYDLRTNEARTMDITTNSFCAGGIALGDGRWINAGGNQAIGRGGQALNDEELDLPDIYKNEDGGLALRVLTPCDDGDCDWIDDPDNYMNSRRWYPEVETLADGSAIIIGGDEWGGFVNDEGQNNPTYEYYPNKGDDIHMQFLEDTMPANLYPLTWLLPSGLLFINAGFKNMLFDHENNEEFRLPDTPDAVKVYPASGATTMLLQTKANNWTAPILMCGGSDIKDNEWTDHQDNVDWFINQHDNAKTCVQITPNSTDAQWESLEEDDMPEARSMGQLIPLPDGRYFLGNGVEKGVAGYDASGTPYGTDPIYSPALFDPRKPAGERWTRDGMEDASLPRLYHSSAILLPDGSVMTAGSNPYADFQTNGSTIQAGPNSTDTPAEWWSETRVELFYPDYFEEDRPSSLDDITSISYGGDAMTADIPSDELDGVDTADDVKVRLIRPGFSTHGINMGQRFVELETSLEKNDDGAKLHIAPLPPNPNVLAPGPCLLFKVIKGIPSKGTMVMIGSGKIETQPTGEYPTLPETSGFDTEPSDDESQNANKEEDDSSALAFGLSTAAAGLASVGALMILG